MKQIYFDAASTTKISEAALTRYQETSRLFYGNPSSIHQTGKEAHSLLEETRKEIRELLSLHEYDITFTGGASESNAIVLSSLLWKRKPGELLISPLEHASVTSYKTLLKEKGFSWKTFAAPKGYISLDKLVSSLNEHTQMVVLSAVHNVLGTIQPVAEIYKAVKAFSSDIHVHLDATQAIGKCLWDIHQFPCDSLSLSAHKIHGPRGIGILAVRKKVNIRVLSAGGGQENGMRGGTENLPAITSYAEALKETIELQDTHLTYLQDLRERLQKQLAAVAKVSYLSPPDASAVPNILSISTPLPSEVFLRLMNDKGFALSASSACSNNAKHTRKLNTGITGFSPQMAQGAVRISWDRYTTPEDIDTLAQAVREIFPS